jgi:hypothetical protein
VRIFSEIKELVRVGKSYTQKVLKKLMVIEKEKLYCDLKYSSLYKYIVKELGYSDAEASIRVNATRLMLKSEVALTKIESGELTLTNAACANKVLQGSCDQKFIEDVVGKASGCSTREFKKIVSEDYQIERRETLVLSEFMLLKFDRLRKVYGDLSTHELIQIMLEKELSAPGKVQRVRKTAVKNSRFISKGVKYEVYTGECANCGVRHGLEYDHKLKFSHGGDNSAGNIQLLCGACNKRKEIKLKELNFFC